MQRKSSLFIGFFEQGLGLLQTEKRYADAATYFRLASEMNPDSPGIYFYLAWAYAGKGDKKKALQSLSQAIDKGFSDLAAISDNKAFDQIRNDPQYQKSVASLKKNK
jgi:tetratricopeptide (TPR) repeat protein